MEEQETKYFKAEHMAVMSKDLGQHISAWIQETPSYQTSWWLVDILTVWTVGDPLSIPTVMTGAIVSNPISRSPAPVGGRGEAYQVEIVKELGKWKIQAKPKNHTWIIVPSWRTCGCNYSIVGLYSILVLLRLQVLLLVVLVLLTTPLVVVVVLRKST